MKDKQATIKNTFVKRENDLIYNINSFYYLKKMSVFALELIRMIINLGKYNLTSLN